jgi:hypothetical protein
MEFEDWWATVTDGENDKLEEIGRKLHQQDLQLTDLAVQLREVLDQVSMHNRAFFEVPPGSSAGAKPLIEWLRVMTETYQRTSMITRAAIWFVATIAGLGIAVQQILGWFT